MVSAMDDAIGGVLGKLRSAGIEENTLIFFISDNGGPTSVNASSNAPFRGVKGDLREGGIRSPFLVQWKGRLPAGALYRKPVIQLDIFPTALAAAAVSPSGGAALDGVDLLPFLTGKEDGVPHETLFWRFNFPPNQPKNYKWAIRRGEWKLFTDVGGNNSEDRGSGKVMLVNLAADPSERIDLAERSPEKVRELQEAFDAWNAELQEPGGPDGKNAAPERPRKQKRRPKSG
jgi:arylsulfatase A-like enzyme